MEAVIKNRAGRTKYLESEHFFVNDCLECIE